MINYPKKLRINEMGNVERLTPNGGWQETKPAHMKYDAEAYRELQKDVAARSRKQADILPSMDSRERLEAIQFEVKMSRVNLDMKDLAALERRIERIGALVGV